MEQSIKISKSTRGHCARAIIANLVFLFTLSFAAHASGSATFYWEGESVTALSIELIKGDIVIRPSPNNRIEISAVKRGRDAEVRQVKLELEENSSEISIRAVYPARKSRDEPKTRVEIDFEVRLPPGVRLIGRTEVGNIDALHLSNPVRATSVVGDIRISTSSHAEAKTTNGDIEVSMGHTAWSGTLDFRTTNGNIALEIPRSSNVEISATSTNGEFDTDIFPVEGNRYGIPGARIRGKLGTGGRGLKLRTVNGDLKLSGSGD